MANDAAKAKRILHIKIKTPSADATTLLTTMMKNALPLYKAFGDAQVRLLRNADVQTQFLQVIEYQTDQTFELNRQKLASEPIMYNYLQASRSVGCRRRGRQHVRPRTADWPYSSRLDIYAERLRENFRYSSLCRYVSSARDTSVSGIHLRSGRIFRGNRPDPWICHPLCRAGDGHIYAGGDFQLAPLLGFYRCRRAARSGFKFLQEHGHPGRFFLFVCLWCRALQCRCLVAQTALGAGGTTKF